MGTKEPIFWEFVTPTISRGDVRETVQNILFIDPDSAGKGYPIIFLHATQSSILNVISIKTGV